ncbi:SpoIIE family protein phosphatase [bacterium]|nr:SpoIIE family protein phosphatase [bacterium]
MFKDILKILLIFIGVGVLILALSGAGLKLYHYFFLRDTGFDTQWINNELVVTNVRKWNIRIYRNSAKDDKGQEVFQGDTLNVVRDSEVDSNDTPLPVRIQPLADSTSSQTGGGFFRFTIGNGKSNGLDGFSSFLEPGDVILAVDGDPVISESLWQAKQYPSIQKGNATLLIRRGDDILTFRDGAVRIASLNGSVILIIFGILVGSLFWLVGFIVFIKKPYETPNILYYLWSLTIFITISMSFLSYFDSFIVQYARELMSFIQALNPALFLHFFLVFPNKKRIISGSRKWLLLPIYLLPLLINIDLYLPSGAISGTPALTFTILSIIIFAGEYVIGLAALIHSSRNLRSAREKRQLKLIRWGILIAIIPFILFLISFIGTLAVIISLYGFNIQEIVHLDPEQLPLIYKGAFLITGVAGGVSLLLTILFFPLIPLSFAYGILKFGIMDIQLIIRRSLIYSILTAFIVSIYFLVVYGLSRLTLALAGRSNPSVSIIAGVVVAVLFNPVRLKVQNWIDKKFFRDRYDFRQALEELSEQIARVTNIDDLLTETSQKVRDLLHIPRIITFVKANSHFYPRNFLGYDDQSVSSLKISTEPGGLAEHLILNRAPLIIPSIQREETIEILSPEEKKILGDLKVRMIMPIILGNQLLGFQTYEEKSSQQYYGEEDQRLLKNLANQLGIALENHRLYQEEIKKKQIERELLFAREIQQGFLPKEIPVIKGYRFFGVNLPVQEVGGDYYDFIPLEHGQTAIAIADVAGKGYSGALLMSNLQAMLRVSAVQQKGLPEMIAGLNEQIFENSPPDKYITFFYCQLNTLSNHLRYVNAGHNPPLLINNTGDVCSLTTGGMVLGAFNKACYQEATVPLDHGDRIVLYTDGVTELFNKDEEEFGVSRLISTVKEFKGLDPEPMANRILEKLDDFSNGLERDDDITLVIIKRE